MKIVNYLIGFSSAVAMMAVVAVVSSSTFASSTSVNAKNGPNYSAERHEAMTAAVDSGDYNAWKELMSENGRNARVLDVINEDNFDKFVEAKKLMDEGKIEEAKAIREELGLKAYGQRDSMEKKWAFMKGVKKGFKMGRNFDSEHHQAVIDAMESNDYEAWKELMTEDGRNPRILESINANNFETFVDAHQLMVDGNVEEANVLFEELGIDMPGKMMRGKGSRGCSVETAAQNS